MKITLCGSIAFIDEMSAAKRELVAMGHEVKMPPTEIIDGEGKLMDVKEYYAIRKAATTQDGWIWDRKAMAMKLHFDKVMWADAIVVLNHTKNNVAHYIGANTLLEMGLAFHHGKKIYLLNPIPQLSYTEEILGMKPEIIHGDLRMLV